MEVIAIGLCLILHWMWKTNAETTTTYADNPPAVYDADYCVVGDCEVKYGSHTN